MLFNFKTCFPVSFGKCQLNVKFNTYVNCKINLPCVLHVKPSFYERSLKHIILNLYLINVIGFNKTIYHRLINIYIYKVIVNKFQ